jgi:hypothetical protein
MKSPWMIILSMMVKAMTRAIEFHRIPMCGQGYNDDLGVALIFSCPSLFLGRGVWGFKRVKAQMWVGQLYVRSSPPWFMVG